MTKTTMTLKVVMMNMRYLLVLIALISASVVTASDDGVTTTTKAEENEMKTNDGDSSSSSTSWLMPGTGTSSNNNNNNTSSSNSYSNYLRGGPTTAASPFKNLHNITNKTACDIIKEHDLPEECSCYEPNRGVVVECLKKFNSTYFNDTIGMKINIDPCNSEGSRVSIDVTEKDHDIDYAIVGIRAGEAKNFPIPGCAIIVPYVGHLGLDAAVLVYGNPDQLTLKVGLNACAVIHDKELCASSIPGLNQVLPWWVLSGTYSFGDFCSTNGTSSSFSASTPNYIEPTFMKNNNGDKDGGLWSLPWFMKTNKEEDEKVKTIFDLSDAAYE